AVHGDRYGGDALDIGKPPDHNDNGRTRGRESEPRPDEYELRQHFKSDRDAEWARSLHGDARAELHRSGALDRAGGRSVAEHQEQLHDSSTEGPADPGRDDDV